MSNVIFLCGSLRKQSSSMALTKALAEAVSDQNATNIADISALPHFNSDLVDDPNVAAFVASIAAADGVVIVTPEYNYSVPGVLKNAIDWASRPALQSVFRDKQVFVVSVSGGALGGVRAQGHLKYILNGMLANVFTGPEVVVPRSNAAVTDGVFSDTATLGFASEKLREFTASLTSQ